MQAHQSGNARENGSQIQCLQILNLNFFTQTIHAVICLQPKIMLMFKNPETKNYNQIKLGKIHQRSCVLYHFLCAVEYMPMTKVYISTKIFTPCLPRKPIKGYPDPFNG